MGSAGPSWLAIPFPSLRGDFDESKVKRDKGGKFSKVEESKEPEDEPPERDLEEEGESLLRTREEVSFADPDDLKDTGSWTDAYPDIDLAWALEHFGHVTASSNTFHYGKATAQQIHNFAVLNGHTSGNATYSKVHAQMQKCFRKGEGCDDVAHGIPGADGSGECTVREACETMQRLIESYPRFKTKRLLWRGIRLPGRKALARALAKMEPGNVIRLKGYQNTSARKRVAEQFRTKDYKTYPDSRGETETVMLEIFSDRGIPFRGFSDSPGEWEVLLGHNWRYRVMGIHKDAVKKHPVVTLKVLG